MGIFGFGDDAGKGTVVGTTGAPNSNGHGSALQGAEKEPKGLAKLTVGIIQPLLDIGIDGKGPLPSAQHVADTALAKSGGDAEAAIDRIVKSHLAAAGAGGFVTGIGGFATMIVALPANILEFYLVATRMTAALAAVRGYDLSRPHIRSAVLLALVGADADDLLRKAGIPSTSGHLTDMVAEKLPGPALMVLNKAVAFRLVSRVTATTGRVFGRGIPLAGGAISGGMDSYLLKRIADHAREEFPPVVAGQVTAS